MFTENILFMAAVFAGFVWIIFPVRKVMPIIFFVIYILYLYLARMGDLSQDLTKFSEWISESFEGYFVYREYLFFATGRLFYGILKNARWAILAQDLFWLISIIVADRQIANGKRWSGYAPIILCSFMAVLGAQNFYRQFLAICVVTLGYTTIRYGGEWKASKGSVVAISGVFFHNSAALAGPLFIAPWIKKLPILLKILGVVICLALFVLGLLAMSYGDLSEIKKSNASTGLNLSWIYVLLLFLTWLVPLYASKFKIIEAVRVSPGLIVGTIITAVTAILFNSAPAERIGLMFYVIGLTDVIYIVDKWPRVKRRLTLAMMLVLLFIPTYIFPNARQFLF